MEDVCTPQSLDWVPGFGLQQVKRNPKAVISEPGGSYSLMPLSYRISRAVANVSVDFMFGLYVVISERRGSNRSQSSSHPMKVCNSRSPSAGFLHSSYSDKRGNNKLLHPNGYVSATTTPGSQYFRQ